MRIVKDADVNKAKKLIIMGAGAFARETLWAVNEAKQKSRPYKVLGFLDDDESKRNLPVFPGSTDLEIRDLKILGSLDYIIEMGFTFDFILPAIGSTEAKRDFTERLTEYGCFLPSPIIHDSVQIGYENKIGDGTIIFANSSVTCNSTLGVQVNINPHCSVAHDVRIGNFCNLSPGVHLTGNVSLEEGVNIGTGAVVLPGVKIGCWSVIGAGAVVKEDIPPHSVAAGVPAKIIHSRL